MIIDSHQHFWEYNPVRDSWIDDTMKVIRKDFLPKDLKLILEDNAIDGCIAVQADQSEEETAFLLQCANGNQFVKGVVGWVDLQAVNVEERLAYFNQNQYLKGIRHIIQAEKKGYMNRSAFQNGISKLKKFGLVYDILITQTQLSETIELVKEFPEQIFVLDHIGKPEISKGISEKWQREIKILAGYENTYCKLSGMVTETENFIWEKRDFYPFIDTILNIFGTERILFGSDWPVSMLAASYKETLGIIQDHISKLSPTEQRNIMGLNAQKIYNLKQ